jgi:hypothetical protein
MVGKIAHPQHTTPNAQSKPTSIPPPLILNNKQQQQLV